MNAQNVVSIGNDKQVDHYILLYSVYCHTYSIILLWHYGCECCNVNISCNMSFCGRLPSKNNSYCLLYSVKRSFRFCVKKGFCGLSDHLHYPTDNHKDCKGRILKVINHSMMPDIVNPTVDGFQWFHRIPMYIFYTFKYHTGKPWLKTWACVIIVKSGEFNLQWYSVYWNPNNWTLFTPRW